MGLTPHIAAEKDDIAKTVIMPGDPLRSKFIAENFLETPRLVNNIRGVQGYTGTYEGKMVTVMSHGVGIPSVGVYAYELFHFYDIDRIIRTGSAGSIDNDCKVGDVLISNAALTNSGFLNKFKLGDDYTPTASKRLYDMAVNIANENKIQYHMGMVLTDELYYDYLGDMTGYWHEKGALAVEMEAACLYAFAAAEKKEALALFTISNNILTGEEMDPDDRVTTFNNMITIALKLAKNA